MKELDGPFVPPRSGTTKQLVVFLHGYGSSGDDLISIAEDWREALPDAAFVSPHAPDVCEAWPAGHQWFPIRAISPEAMEREKHASIVAPVLNNFIDGQLKKWGVADSALAVAGFSQGAMMAMYAMPRRAAPCAAVLGWSGMLLDAKGLKGPNIVKVPVLAIHGDADEIVPPENLQRVHDGFSAAGFDIETMMRPGLGHGIDQVSIRRSLQFIQEGFEKAAQSSKKQVKA
jgi:phospholipase/carboxylesterase